VMIDSSHVRGVHIPSRKRICCTPRWSAYEKNGWPDQREGCHGCHYSSYGFSHDSQSLWWHWASRELLPATQEDVMYMNGNNNGYRPQGGQTWNQSHPYYQGGNQSNSFNPNQPSLKDLFFWES
jgi:hypothetical protein